MERAVRLTPSARRRLAGIACAVLCGLGLYALLVRPWFLRWGATAEETVRPLAGDSLISDASNTATRAITIQAPVERVWPWIVQIGQDRGGFYSYTWIENLFGCRMINADRIHPEWQSLSAGGGVRLHPDMPPVPVALVEPNHALVLGSPVVTRQGLAGTWAFILEPAPGGATRLIARWRGTGTGLVGRVMNHCLLEPAHFVMERRMLLSIRERAEAAAGARPASAPPAQQEQRSPAQRQQR